jgi:Domain of unknown function (DUF4352)
MRLAISVSIWAVVLASTPLAGQISPAAHAQPVGTPLTTIIGFGDQYNGGDELYDARITVLEIVRGPKAWDALQRASASNAPPANGFEYLLARVRFEFSARTSPHHYSYTLAPKQFTAISAAGKEYDPAAVAAPPDPRLRGNLQPDSSVEGWLAFSVPQSDRKPLMLFRADVGSVIHEGGGSYFQLYERYVTPSRRAKAP